MSSIPVPGPAHLLTAARVGWRLFGWLRYVGFYWPGACAVVCFMVTSATWGGVSYLPEPPAPVGYICNGLVDCQPTNDGTGTQLIAASTEPVDPVVIVPPTVAHLFLAPLTGLLVALAAGSGLVKALDSGTRGTPSWKAYQAQQVTGAVIAAGVDVYQGVKSDHAKAKRDVKKAKGVREKWKGWRDERQSSSEIERDFDALASLPAPPTASGEGGGAFEASTPAASAVVPVPVAYPDGHDPYATDAELVAAGAMAPEVAAGRAAAATDPYASPAEQAAAVAHDHVAEANARHAAETAIAAREEAARADQAAKWRVTNQDLAGARDQFADTQRRRLAELKKGR